jgi:hypothetical protein
MSVLQHYSAEATLPSVMQIYNFCVILYRNVPQTLTAACRQASESTSFGLLKSIRNSENNLNFRIFHNKQQLSRYK